MFSHFRKVPGVHDQCHDGQPDGVHGPAARGSLRQVKILLRGIDAGNIQCAGNNRYAYLQKDNSTSFGVFILKESHYTDFEISSPQTVFADHGVLVIGGDNLWTSNPMSSDTT